MLDARKRGDYAFKDKDFKTAIDCYSQVCACSLNNAVFFELLQGKNLNVV